MRGDGIQWVGRLVAAVFGVGVLALLVAVVMMVRQSEGVPPWPILLGVLGLVALILLAGACLALISIAVSVRRSVEMLQRLAPAAPEVVADEAPEMQGPFTPTDMAVAPLRPVRPGRVLVAER